MSSYYNNSHGSGNYYSSGGGPYQQQPPPTSEPSQTFHQGYGDPNAWQQQQQQQQQQYSQQQPVMSQSSSYPPPQQQPASLWDPGAAAKMAAFAVNMASNSSSGAMNDSMMFSLADEASKTLLQSKSAQLIPGYMEQGMNVLRTYFAVDNRYVVLKMKRILFPFICKHWKRQQKDVAPSSGNSMPSIAYQLPVNDDCAPDLYLPIMSGITYVLLSAFLSGTVGKFNPQVIPSVTSQCLIVQILEVSCIRLGFYMMQSQVALLDLFSYTGYKYFGLCINMIVAIVLGRQGLNLLAGSRGYYLSFLWTAAAMAYFMLKTMANNIPLHTAPHGPKREVMVLIFAASQLVTMWLVSQTKFL